MLTLTKNQKVLVIIASIYSLLQSVAWFVMSLLCILYYLDSKNNSKQFDNPTTDLEIFNFYVYGIFLNSNNKADTVLTPDGFFIFMWIYLIGDLIWVILSINQIHLIRISKKNPINLMKCSSAMMILFSLIDLILVILIAVDYDLNCQDFEILKFSCVKTYIPVLVIAARGFILWCLNLACVYVFYKIIKSAKKERTINMKLRDANTTIPRPTLQKPSRSNKQIERPNSNINPNRMSSNYWNADNNFNANQYGNRAVAPFDVYNQHREQQTQRQQSFAGY